MRHASTIAIARTLLALGRPDDVIRMIEPLVAEQPEDESGVLLHALLGRIQLLVHADPGTAKAHIDRAFSMDGAPEEVAFERLLWRGWLRAWPHRAFFEPALALADLSDAHALARRLNSIHGGAWAHLGAAFLFLTLREPGLARHLLERVNATGWQRHDHDLRFWMLSLRGAGAMQTDDPDELRLVIEEARAAAIARSIRPYHARLAMLELRLGIAEGRPVDEVDRQAQAVDELLQGEIRSYCPVTAELPLCRADVRLAHGDAEGAAQILDHVSNDQRDVVYLERRIAERLGRLERRDVTLPDGGLHAPRPPAGFSWIPFWETMPPLGRVQLPILLIGERGTGKKFLAQEVHRAGRIGEPFVMFDCSMPAPGDIELLLFGSGERRGAVDEAGRGTLFLREIDRMPAESQRRLARMIENGLEPSVIGSTTLSRHAAVDGSRITPALRAAIARVVVELPPLRDRRDQIPILITELIAKLRPNDLPLASITADAVQSMVAYEWPGNIRQLQNEIERMLTLVGSEPAPVIQLRDLPDDVLARASGGTGGDGAGTPTLDFVLSQAERAHIVRVMKRNGGSVTASAEDLGLTRQGLYKKMKRLDIDPGDFHHNPASALNS